MAKFLPRCGNKSTPNIFNNLKKPKFSFIENIYQILNTKILTKKNCILCQLSNHVRNDIHQQHLIVGKKVHYLENASPPKPTETKRNINQMKCK